MPVSYKDKLTSYEVKPPKSAWRNISAELTKNSDLFTTERKLSDLEIIPPAGIFAKIVNDLDKPIPEKSPVKSKPVRPLYYFLAAASFIAVVCAGFLYFNRYQADQVKLVTNHTPFTNQNSASPGEPSTNISPEKEDQATDNPEDQVTESPAKNKKNYDPTARLQNATVTNAVFPENKTGITVAAKPIRNSKGEIIQDNRMVANTDNHYISITGPNGQQTKISAKFMQMLLFINDDNDVDQVDGYFDKNFLQSLVWKTRFQDWRNKIINMSFVPSSTNFMDILEFRDMILKDE